MDFDLNENQKLLKKTAREFLSAECPARLVRSVEEKGIGYSRELWEKMADLGWIGLVVEEELGGSGAGFRGVRSRSGSSRRGRSAAVEIPFRAQRLLAGTVSLFSDLGER